MDTARMALEAAREFASDARTDDYPLVMAVVAVAEQIAALRADFTGPFRPADESERIPF